ncbi:helix-turn-helix transcriptional regulator [Lachnospiraceae bacterium C1.1]|nr:helix-turn-helix transcriptional regulator [Lachnospiraceae bacterium C1.1]
MRVLVLNANSLVKITINKILDLAGDAEAVFANRNDDNFENLTHDPSFSSILVSACKGYHGSYSIINNLINDGLSSKLIILAENSSWISFMNTPGLDDIRFLSVPFSRRDFMDILTPKAAAPKQPAAANPFIDEFRNLIMKRDYVKMYNSITALEEKISLHAEKNCEETIFYMNDIFETAMKMINCIEPALIKRYRERFPLSEEVIKNRYRLSFALYDLFDEVYRQRCLQKRPQFSSLFDYIDKNIYNELTLSDAADACGVSQSYLSRELKSFYSLGFNTYVQIAKIMLAKKNFYFNDDKIIDVAFQLSYNEPSYFCKVFKKIEGVTPTFLKNEMTKYQEICPAM